jgi:hypothetical protein
MAPRMGGSFGLEKKRDTHTQISVLDVDIRKFNQQS